MTSLIAGEFDYDANGQDCVDGFSEAFYGRLEQFLDPAVRRSQSAWGFLEAGVE